MCNQDFGILCDMMCVGTSSVVVLRLIDIILFIGNGGCFVRTIVVVVVVVVTCWVGVGQRFDRVVVVFVVATLVNATKDEIDQHGHNGTDAARYH